MASKEWTELVLSEQDKCNLLDALAEWYEMVGPKEMDEDDSGLDEDRFLDLMCRIKSSLTAPEAQPDILDFEWKAVDNESDVCYLNLRQYMRRLIRYLR